MKVKKKSVGSKNMPKCFIIKFSLMYYSTILSNVIEDMSIITYVSL